MTIWRAVEGAAVGPHDGPSAVTIGTFDGVHRGHQTLLARCRGSVAGLPLVAVTFDPHPMAVVRPDLVPPQLTTLERRVALLRAAGADEVRVLAFGPEMSTWSPEVFVQRVVVDELHAASVVVGENFRFGARAAGDVAFLVSVASDLGFLVEGVDLEGDDEAWSSSRIRTLIAEGRVEEAGEILGRPPEVEGVVVRGDQRGRELGFPTANVPVDERFAVPSDGVYATRLVVDGRTFPAATSVGTNPTFDGVERRVESYVIDHPGPLDLYGRTVRVEFVAHLRGMEAFDSIDALVTQMHADVDAARTLLS